MGLKYALSPSLFVGNPSYRLLLDFDGGNDSAVFVDSGVNNYTINWFTNDPGNNKGQSNTQFLFGASSLKSDRGGAPPGSGGRSSQLTWSAGTGMDWGSSPSLVIGGPIYPTFPTGSDAQTILMLRRNANSYWKLSYDDAGVLHYFSIDGGVTFTNLATSTVFLQYGQWNWFFLNMHASDTSLWLGTAADGFVTNDASGADTSPYNMGSFGAMGGSVSVDPIASGGTMNAYVDHLYCALNTHINPVFNGSGVMPVPTTQPS